MGILGYLSGHKQQERTTKFKRVARELSNSFPALDLRFNLQEGSNTVRVLAPDLSSRALRMSLDKESERDLVVRATFELKRLAKQYDA